VPFVSHKGKKENKENKGECPSPKQKIALQAIGRKNGGCASFFVFFSFLPLRETNCTSVAASHNPDCVTPPAPLKAAQSHTTKDSQMPQLILIRHGQSQWNLENRFTGWWDVDVTEKGAAEAWAAGELMKAKGIAPDTCYTSVQSRAIKTLNLALEAMGRLWLPVTKDWQLNERHYGGLTGLDKAETAAKHGENQVHIWRRSFDIPPPPLDAGSPYDLSKDPRYAGIAIPNTESLKDTIARVLPYYNSAIVPELQAGKTVLISAHGNSLRALVKHLSGISDEDITGLEIPTGQPIIYELDNALNATDRYYLSER
jgi:2,3-bisphosphoglycerate-dependent phosphoglycerate mutase